MKKYYTRLIEPIIERKLKSSGAVLVAGPKFCGKTTTCMLYQKSFIKLNTKQTISIAKLDPKGVLIGDKPRLIDEWQTLKAHIDKVFTENVTADNEEEMSLQIRISELDAEIKAMISSVSADTIDDFDSTITTSIICLTSSSL